MLTKCSAQGRARMLLCCHTSAATTLARCRCTIAKHSWSGTQAMRSAYGDPPEAGSSGVRLTLDTNVVMLKENPYSAMVSDR